MNKLIEKHLAEIIVIALFIIILTSCGAPQECWQR